MKWLTRAVGMAFVALIAGQVALAQALDPPDRTLATGISRIQCLDFSSDGSRIAVGTEDRSVRLFGFPGGEPKQKIEGFSGSIDALCFSPDGKWLAAASVVPMAGSHSAGTIQIFDARIMPGTLHQVRMGHHGVIVSLAFSPDSRSLASASRDETVRLWDVRTDVEKEKLRWMGESDAMNAVAFSPNGEYVAACTAPLLFRFPEILVWQAKTGKLLHRIRGDMHEAHCLTFTANSRTLITGDYDGGIRFWDVRTGKSRTIESGHTKHVMSVIATPDGKTLISASTDGSIHFRDIGTGAIRRTIRFTLNKMDTGTLRLSPDGRWIAMATREGEVLAWNAQ